jgi:hypothetical protein
MTGGVPGLHVEPWEHSDTSDRRDIFAGGWVVQLNENCGLQENQKRRSKRRRLGNAHKRMLMRQERKRYQDHDVREREKLPTAGVLLIHEGLWLVFANSMVARGRYNPIDSCHGRYTAPAHVVHGMRRRRVSRC